MASSYKGPCFLAPVAQSFAKVGPKLKPQPLKTLWRDMRGTGEFRDPVAINAEVQAQSFYRSKGCGCSRK